MRALLAGAVLMTAVPAYAAPPGWVVDKAVSSVVLSSSFDGELVAGTIRRWDAQVRFDPKDLANSSARITFDTASIASGDADQEAALPHRLWFWSEKYPQATFVTRSFRSLGGQRYAADGDLTVRGVTKPLTLPFTLAITGGTARMKATVDVNRLAFGVGQDEWKSTKVIPAAVKVTIALTAKRAK